VNIKIFFSFLVWLTILNYSQGTTTTAEPLRLLPGSVRLIEPATQTEHGQKGHRPALINTSLTADQLNADMELEIALKMHNLSNLQSRVERNEIISAAEMASTYWPTALEHKIVLDWLKAQGFSIIRTDSNYLAIFVRAKVSVVQTSLKTKFARVVYNDTEYTSAISAPSLPQSLANVVVGIHGLQPHARMVPRHTLLPQASATNTPPYLPNQIANAYNASSLGYTGSGQTIGIISNAYPASSDLTKFWNAASVTVPASNIVQVNINGGPAIPSDSNSTAEACLDVEWASALAPGATIMVYGSNINDPAGFDRTYQQVYLDAQTRPGFSQFSLSFGINESLIEADYLVIESQFMANLASVGITILAASGDGGSNPDPSTGSYIISAPLDVSYPASDPCVTGVGATHLVFNSSGTVSSESAWNGSGGGSSHYYQRPLWQMGTGVTQGTYRLTPDVSAVGDPQTGATVYIGGSAQTIGGTSLATPIWAAFCAIINQSRSANKLTPLGYLNPRLYPLIGSSAFRDITSGNNGVYTATSGYDLCSGVGAPNVANIIQAALVPVNQAPLITTSISNRFTTLGQSASFAISVVGNQPFSYQWQRKAVGTSQWYNLTNSGNYSGIDSPFFTVSASTLSMSGDLFRCIVTNGSGSTTSTSISLTVSPTGMSTLAGWPGAPGFLDGIGTAARFDANGGIRLDAAGNIYVADSINNAIRKVTSSGIVTTLLGASGNAGSLDGPVSTATINGPGGVAIDSSGNIYIADSLNYTIRKISTSGIVSTLAGSPGISGKADGTGNAARFIDPENLAVDYLGNIWVADGRGCTVREITPSGTVATIAGKALSSGSIDGTGTTARFGSLLGITVDTTGNVFVSDSGNNTIRKITAQGVVSTLAGTAGLSGSTNGSGAAARFMTPSGLAVDAAGNLYVCDSGNNTIRKITAQGDVSTIAGSPGVADSADGIGSAGYLNSPGDIALDTSGNLYVADFYNNTVRKIIPTGAPVVVSTQLNKNLIAGTSTQLSVTASGVSPLTYQWSLNGTPLIGATTSTYTITNFQESNAGIYTVSIGSSLGSTSTTVATLAVQNSRLLNLSASANVSGTTAPLIAGFVISGSGTKNLLLRGIGPTLNNYAVKGALPQPLLTFYNSKSAVLATNSGWSNPLILGSLNYQSIISQASASQMNAVGAFALDVKSADSALIANLPLNQGTAYTVQVAGINATSGVALDEIYDMDSLYSTARLVNISAGAITSSGSNILAAGFVVGGTGVETILVRGDGPALSSFGIPGVLTNTVLTIFDQSGKVIASNSGWSNAPVRGNSQIQSTITQATQSTMSSVGAFSLTPNSGDSALTLSLPPGVYSAQVTGLNGTTGYALVEVYEVSQ
jgi:sugar lactone lactonase YvrE